MILEWIQSQAIKLLGGALAIALIALAIVIWRADAISAARDKAIEARVAESVRHDVTRASLQSLELRMAELVAEGELSRERLDEAMEQVERDTAPLREQADRLERGEIAITEVEGL